MECYGCLKVSERVYWLDDDATAKIRLDPFDRPALSATLIRQIKGARF